MVGITPPVENAYSVKTATNFLGIPFSQQKHDSSEAAGKRENGYSLVIKILHLQLKSQTKKENYPKPNFWFLLLDALGFVPRSLKHFAFQWSLNISQSFLREPLFSSRKSLTNKVVKKAAREKFHLIIPSPFPSFNKDVHSQAPRCNYSSKSLNSPFLSLWEKLSTVARHLLFL